MIITYLLQTDEKVNATKITKKERESNTLTSQQIH